MLPRKDARAHTDPVPTIPGVPTQVLVAPDSFKGTFSAREVAEAVGTGLREAGCRVDLCPVADGGEGTLEALVAPLGAEMRWVEVNDPLGRAVQAQFGLAALQAGRGRDVVGIIEVASDRSRASRRLS